MYESGCLKGLESNTGHASINAPEDEEDKIHWLHNIVVPILPLLKKAGADSFSLSITYHCDSGALGFSREEIQMIAEMECDLPIDCLIDCQE